ncbi:hypothetical protein D9M68_475140 [compost metagenome]
MTAIAAGRFDSFSTAESVASRLQARGFADLLRREGAKDVERADGQWVDGRWVDFDPLVPPVPAGARRAAQGRRPRTE